MKRKEVVIRTKGFWSVIGLFPKYTFPRTRRISVPVENKKEVNYK